MRKKTSMVIGIAIATILTTYISAVTLSNQAFAQPGGWVIDTGVFARPKRY
jgi:hypothetical protein